jgi:hypothetical protein
MEVTWGLALRTWWSMLWRNLVLGFAMGLGLVGVLAIALPASAGQAPPANLLTLGVVAVAGALMVAGIMLLASFVIIQRALKANSLLIDPRTASVSFGTAFLVWWGMLWRGFVYGLGLAVVIVPAIMVANGSPGAMLVVYAVQLSASLAIGLMALKHTLQAQVDEMTKSAVYVG